MILKYDTVLRSVRKAVFMRLQKNISSTATKKMTSELIKRYMEPTMFQTSEAAMKDVRILVVKSYFLISMYSDGE